MELYENRLTVAAFQTLRIQCGMEPLDSGMVKRALDASLLRLVGIDNGEIVGMARVVGDGAFVFVIADLLVLPERRGEGIGTVMMKYLLDAVALSLPDGRWGVVTLVAAHGREAFYEQMGFHRLPRGETGHAMQVFVQGKK